MKNNDHYVLPSLHDAKQRSKTPTKIERGLFNLPETYTQIGINKKYYIRTYGCSANQRDTETIAGIMEDMGYTYIEDEFQADVLIFNTCAIRKNAEDKVFGEIGMLKKIKLERPDVIFVLCGCMAQEEDVISRILTTYDQIDLVFGTHNIHRLPELLEQVVIDKKRAIEVYSKEGDVIEGLPVHRFGKHKAWVNIMYGCDKFCTYCIVPYTRGKQRSRLMEDVLNEVKELKQQGYKEITLLGQNVNAYGKDLGMEDGFATLVEEVAKIGVERVKFQTSHPRDYSFHLIEVMAKYPNIMPALHLPVQSGDNDILKLMGRGYTVEHYKELVDAMKKAIPSITFSTDIIVGFPGESEEQFLHTLDLVDYCQFSMAYTYVYSPRVGTPAAIMKDQVDSEVALDRLYRLNAQITKWSNYNNQKYLGKVVKVLVDGPSKKHPEIFAGYSEENKPVNFTGDNIQCGDIVDVEITDVKSYSLNGVKR